MAAADAVDVHQHLWPDAARRPAARTHAARRTCGAGRCTRAASRRTTSTRRTTTCDAAHRGGPRGRGRPGLRLASPPRSASRAWSGRRPARCSPPGTRGPRALPGPLPGLGVGADGRPRPRRARRPAARRLRRRAAAGHRPALAGRVGARRRRCCGSPRLAGKPVFVHPGPELAPPAGRAAAGVVGARRRLRRRSCRPPGGAGTRSAAARCSRRCGCCSAPAPGWRRCTTSGTSPAAASRRRSTRTSSSTPRRTDRRRSTRWSGCSGIDVLALGSDRPYAAPIDRLLGDAATHAIRVANPRRLLAGPDVSAAPTERVEGRTWPRAS